MIRQVVYNASTGEETIVEIEDSEMVVDEEVIDKRQEALAAINSATNLDELKSAMLNFIDASGIK